MTDHSDNLPGRPGTDEHYEALRRRYADSIWLRSEQTLIEGPIRNSFDPVERMDYHSHRHLYAMKPAPKFRIHIATKSGTRYTVRTSGEIDIILWDTGARLLIFHTIFGEQLTPFAIVSPVPEYKPEARGQRAIGP